MNILLLMAHSIAEYDEMRMFSDLGHDVFAPGAYTDPANPGDDKRPALPTVRRQPDLIAAVGADTMKAKEHLPDAVLDWADVVICHHYPERFLMGQWRRFEGKRVIWRTCGQSDPRLEEAMLLLRRVGLEIVRYSPRERTYFERLGVFAGEDALIRFGKYVDDYGGWTGQEQHVANVTQDFVGRGDHVGYGFWRAVTADLSALPAGPGSEKIGGVGVLSEDAMIDYLRDARAYLYTGTVPASYTLGLIEAMLTGTPVVSIGARAWPGPAELFEAAEIAGLSADRIGEAHDLLADLLHDDGMAQTVSQRQRARARELFSVEAVGRQWQAYLGATAPVQAQARPAAEVLA